MSSPGSGGLCCPSFVQKYYDDITASQSDYDENCLDEESMQYPETESFWQALKRRIKDKCLDICDNTFLTFFYMIETHEQHAGPRPGFGNSVTADPHLATSAGSSSGGSAFSPSNTNSLLMQALLESSAKSSVLWKPQKRHIIGMHFTTEK